MITSTDARSQFLIPTPASAELAPLTPDEDVVVDHIDAEIETVLRRGYDGGIFDVNVPAKMVNQQVVRTLVQRYEMGGWQVTYRVAESKGEAEVIQMIFAPAAQTIKAKQPFAYIVGGTRPNWVKIAPILRELERRGRTARFVHTGQHYDEPMSDVFFRDLGLRDPDLVLGGGGGTQAEQLARMVVDLERDILRHKPRIVVVVGDCTTAIAGALAARMHNVPVAHVEAGLRSGNPAMPEEMNRIVVDQISTILLAPDHESWATFVDKASGICSNVGNVMIDSLIRSLGKPQPVPPAMRDYALVTLHRPSNVDTKEALERSVKVLETIASLVPVMFPVHPRTRLSAEKHGISLDIPGVTLLGPLGYDANVAMMSGAKLVATDSGGIQEETTVLGVPCLTLREETERPITVSHGTNTIVGLDLEVIRREVSKVIEGGGKKGKKIDGWDGHAAERIADVLEDWITSDGGKFLSERQVREFAAR